MDSHAAAVRPAFSAMKVLELARCAILVLRREDGIIVSANPSAEKLFGRGPGELDEVPVTSLLPEWKMQTTTGVAGAANEPAGDPDVFHTRGQWVGGHSFTVEVGFGGSGRDPYVVLTIRELRDHEGGTAELQNLVSLLNATLESTADGLLVVGVDGRITGINANFASMWRIPRTMLATHDDQAVIDLVVEQLEEPDAFLAKVRELYDQPQAESLDVLEFKDGRVFERFSRPQMIGDRIVGRVWSFRDVTAKRQAEVKADQAMRDLAKRADDLRRLAFTDPLTGLGNRALFNEELRRACSSGGPQHAALLLLDLDDFKEVNDVYGHQSGDRMLIELARRIRGVIRNDDIVARIGGDEFVVIIPDGCDADSIAERLVDLSRRPIDVGGVQITPSLSIGIARSGTDCPGRDSGEDLLRRADIAMYAAKAAGKSRFVSFQPEMMSKLIERAALQENLRKALATGAVVPFYQVVVARSGEVVQLEALARWQHEGKLRLPSDFISHAESTGLIRDLGAAMLTKACTDMSGWLAEDAGRSIAINVSGLEIRDTEYAGSVLRILQTAGVDPGQLVLEVTESVFLGEETEVITQLAELRRRGVKISVDDFGTGYSSFGRLHELPVDAVKLDKSFTRLITGGAYHSPIMVSMVDMAHNLGMAVTAEGIETNEQADYLNRIGCDYRQGYLYGRPQALRDVQAALPYLTKKGRRLPPG